VSVVLSFPPNGFVSFVECFETYWCRAKAKLPIASNTATNKIVNFFGFIVS
jgi:hypothetical protein